MLGAKAIILQIKGLILSGDSSPTGPIPMFPFGGQNATFSEEVVNFLKRIEINKRIRAIIFQIILKRFL